MYAYMYGHVCNSTIHVLYECCFIYGCSRIYGHPWLYTWHVGILDQVYAYMYIYGFDIFSDDTLSHTVAYKQPKASTNDINQ